jgi:hypothetical protein
MEHVVCECGSEYDVEELGTTGWSRDPVDVRCEVCGTALKPGNANVHYILIMTKRGHDQKAG